MDAVDNTERIENEYFKKQDGSQQPASQVEISNKNTVHLFLSYSSPDMEKERNYIMRNVYPELKKSCSNLGLQFEIVDVKYSCDDDINTFYHTQDIFAKEIEACQKLSNRPNFVALIGDKYKSSTFPIKIPEDEFEPLLKTLTEDNEDTRILNRWFQKDNNSIPAMFVLQPAQDILGHFDVSIRNKKWISSKEQVHHLLSKAAKVAFEKGHISKELSEKYLTSAIGEEVQQGIISSNNPTKECACFVRSIIIDDLSMATNNACLRAYFDLTENGTQCVETKNRLQELCFGQLKALTKMNFASFKVNWLQNGIDPAYSVHKQYLKAFGESLKSTLLSLVHDYMDILQNQQMSNDTLLSNEINHHAEICKITSKFFVGREELLAKIQNILSHCFDLDPDKKPLLLHGLSGSGKTSLMAMIAKNAKQWTGNEDLVIVTRFIGTSVESNTILNVLQSISQEISQAFGFDVPTGVKRDDFNLAKIHFYDLLFRVKTQPKCLLLILDGLDQLSPSFNNKHFVNWLPRHLHERLMIILSTESNKHNILRNFKFHMDSVKTRNHSSPTISIECTEDSPRTDRTNNPDSTEQSPDTDESTMHNTSLSGDTSKRIEKKRSKRKSSKVSPRMPTIVAESEGKRRPSSLKGNKIVPDIKIQLPTPRNDPEITPMSTPTSETFPDSNDSFVLANDPTFTREGTFEQTLLQGREESNVHKLPDGNDHTNNYPNIYKVEDTLTNENRNAILKYRFTRADRSATQFQSDYVKSCVDICSQPLYVKLVVDEALSWASYDHISTLALPLTASEMIALFFQRLEEKHGTTLVSHSLAYLTSTVHGLSECELLDILSLDNMVHNEIYKRKDPPLNDVIRLPTLLWKTIRHALSDYLLERDVNGLPLMNWSHRLFWEVANQRYLKNEEKVKYINKILSEFYLGSYANTTKQITLEKVGGKCLNAQRHVSYQPLEFQKDQYNIRKLVELPNALLKCKNDKVLFNEVFFNFEWIQAKINALSLVEVLKDMKTYLTNESHKEVQIMYDTFLLCSYEINRNKNAVANQLLGRLSNFDFVEKPYINRLVDGIKEKLHSCRQPVLCLRNKSLPSGKDDLKMSFRHIGDVKFLHCAAVNNDDIIICVSCTTDQTFINFYLLNDGDLLSSIILETKKSLVVYKSEKTSHLYVGYTQLEVIDVNTMTTKTTLENDNVKITCVTDNIDGSIICVTYSNGLLRIYDISNSTILADIGFGGSTIVHTMFLDERQTVLVGPYLNSSWMTVNYSNLQVNKLDSSFTRRVKSTSCIIKMVSHDAIVVSYDNDIHAWNFQTNKFIHTFTGHTSDVYCLVQINADLFASAGEDCVIKLWYLGKNILLQTLRGHNEAILSIAYSRKSNSLASGSKDNTIKVWSLDEFKCKDTYIDHPSSVLSLTISDPTSTIVSACKSNFVKAWQMNNPKSTNETSTTKICHKKPCQVVDFSSDFKTVLTLSENDCIVLWEVQSNKDVWRYDGDVTTACFSTEKSVFYVGTNSGYLLAFKMLKELTEELFSCSTEKTKISFISDIGGDNLLLCTQQGDVLSFNYATKTQDLLCTHASSISCTDVNHDIIAVGSLDCNVSVYIRDQEGATFKHKHTLQGSKKPITCVTIMKSHESVIACNSIGMVRSWSLDTGNELSRFSYSNDGIQCIVGNENDGSLILGGKEPSKFLAVFNLAADDVDVIHLNGHENPVSCLKFTENFRFLLSAGRDGKFIAWDFNSRTLIDSISFNSPITSFIVSSIIENMVYKIVVLMKSGGVAFVDFQVTSRHKRNHSSTNRGHLIMLDNVNVANMTDNQSESEEATDNEKKRCCVIL